MNRTMLLIMAALIVATAGWAYNVTYKTLESIEVVDNLRAKIAKEREALQVLRVEWAYLNRPERLEALVAKHQDQLRLVSLSPDALEEVAVVPFPKSRDTDDAAVAETNAMPMPVFRPTNWVPE